jgi:hypothetical protein
MFHNKNGEKLKDVYSVDKNIKSVLLRKSRHRNGRYTS